MTISVILRLLSFKVDEIEAGPSQAKPAHSHPPALPAESNDDDDVVEVEEDGAVKTEQGDEQSYDYSNDGTDVRYCSPFSGDY
jgi:hypothetical protein